MTLDMTTPKMPSLLPRLSEIALAALVSACLVASASAQSEDPWAAITPEETQITSTEKVSSTEVAIAPEPADIDWSALDTDPSSLTNKSVKLNRKPNTVSPGDAWSWTRSNNPDGSAAVAIKQPVVPFWDTRVGADLKVTTQMPTTSGEVLAQKIANDNQLSQSSGTAWAAMTAPGLGFVWDKTAIEARTDPAQEQSKFGTTMSKSLPLWSDQYSLTLQNGYNVSQQTLVPVFGPGRATRTYEVDQSAKISIADTGMSFIAGQTHSTADDKWLRRIGAEQKIFGGVSITGSISQTVEGAPNSSLTAGFKRHW